MQESLVQAKKELRRQLRKQRKALPWELILKNSEAIAQAVESLPEYQAADTVFCFVSYGGEPHTHVLLQRALQNGKRIFVPRCKDGGEMDLVQICSFDDLKPGMYGILEPDPAAPTQNLNELQFALLPAIACGKDGSRLGQGGGYYDRFLEKYTGKHCVLCFEEFLLDTVPTEKHDCRMQCIVTERQVIRILR